MSYHYDTKVIYGSTKHNKTSFILNGVTYYTTKTGITKKKYGNEKADKISQEEYDEAWNKYEFLFY